MVGIFPTNYVEVGIESKRIGKNACICIGCKLKCRIMIMVKHVIVILLMYKLQTWIHILILGMVIKAYFESSLAGYWRFRETERKRAYVHVLQLTLK